MSNESKKLYRINNPNSDLFTIPLEQGASGLDDDNRIASIGDATLRHIDSLGNKRVVYDSFVCMPDGNLFQIEDNLFWSDMDEFNLKSVSDLKGFMKQNKIPEKYEGIYKEAFENELSRRETSEDVLDQKDNLISYEDWEANPGLSSHWETPQTPKPYVRYVGNCKQVFYDNFPDDHPDAKFINQFLYLINVPWDEFTPKFQRKTNWIINNAQINKYTSDALIELVDQLCNNPQNPEDTIIGCLTKIDQGYGKFFSKRAKYNEYDSDPIYRYFVDLCNDYDLQLKNGISKKRIFGFIKLLGKKLFSSRSPLKDKGIEGRLKKRHWILYHRLKKRYTPQLLINGININTAGRSELIQALGINIEQKPTLDSLLEDEQFEEQYHQYRQNCQTVILAILDKRPFESINELRDTGLVSIVNINNQNSNISNYITRISNACKLAVEQNNIKLITQLPAEFIKEQKLSSLKDSDWKAIWQCYNTSKTSVVKTLK